ASNKEEGKKYLKIFIEILKEKMKIEKSLEEFGINFEEYKKLIPEILADIKKDICTTYNPNSLTDEDYIKLLLKIYYGK
ncbi:MAG: butanol dehydrogenase, partial [Fusobacterium sp.]|nr:butanol dehydrogenase [Fusobacterium sp.]